MKLLLFLIAFLPLALFAQDAAPAPAPAVDASNAALAWLLQLALANPKLAILFTVMGALRSIFKIVFTVVHRGDATDFDHRIAAWLDSNPFARTVAWLLDLVASIKVAHPQADPLLAPASPASGGRTFSLLLPFALAGLLASGVGCALYGKRSPGELVSFTQSFVGIDVSQDPASQVPHFRIGFGRNQGHIIPTSTNALFSPSVDSSISLDSRTASHAINEDFRTGNATTNAQSEVRATTSPTAPATVNSRLR